jgi:hypothetical protein
LFLVQYLVTIALFWGTGGVDLEVPIDYSFMWGDRDVRGSVLQKGFGSSRQSKRAKYLFF